MPRVVWLFRARTLIAFCALFMLTIAALADGDKRVRIIRMNGTFVEGVCTEVGGGYEVVDKNGRKHFIPRNDVRSRTELTVPGDANRTSTSGAAPKSPTGDAPPGEGAITDDDIAKLIGDADADLDREIDVSGDVLPELPINEVSVQEMERISGRNAKRLATPHFILVYTSETTVARRLAARLEVIYRWVYRYMELLGIPPKRPDYKLEIYFFGTYQEYESYGATLGFATSGALGFYTRDNNRSAFFDMNTDPGVVRLQEQLKQPGVDWRTRRRIENSVARRMNYLNLTVVQHEAAHHIHFNMGVFNPRGDMQRWITEGLAQMFEAPPGEAGGSFGAVNHFRLNEFRQLYGKDPKRLGDLRRFIIDDSLWRGGQSYSLGWALHQYLLKKHRDKYAAYMRKVATREDALSFGASVEMKDGIDITAKQQEFEDIFGEIDEKWIEKFMNYVNDLQLKLSVLPD